MVQPFLPEVTTNGEWSLVFIAGKYSHSVLKKPGAGQILVHADHGGRTLFETPRPEVVALAETVMGLLRAALEASSTSTATSSTSTATSSSSTSTTASTTTSSSSSSSSSDAQSATEKERCDTNTMFLYMRLDFIETDSHGPLLSECEGMEPELFFRARPESANEFASEVIKLVKQTK